MELLPFIQNVLSSTKSGFEGLGAIYDLINARLSPNRAAELDYLTNLSQGLVVPQSSIGTALDAPHLSAVVPNVDVFKAIDYIYQLMEQHAGGVPPAAITPVPLTGGGVELAFLFGIVPPGAPGSTPPQLAADTCTFVWQQGQGSFDHAGIQIGYTKGGAEILQYNPLPAVTVNPPLCAAQAQMALLLQYEIPMTGKVIYVRLSSYTAAGDTLGYIDYTYLTLAGSVPSSAPKAPVAAFPTSMYLVTSPPTVLPGPTQVFRWEPVANAVGYALDVSALGTTTRYGGPSDLTTSRTITVPSGGGVNALLTVSLSVFLQNKLGGGGIITSLPFPVQFLTPA